MKKHLRKFCAATTVAAVLFSATPIATPVAHAGWGSVIGGVIGGILNGGGSGGSSGGGNGGGSLGGLSNQQHAHPKPNDHEKLFMLAVEKNDIGTVGEMLNAGVDVNGVYPGSLVVYHGGQTAFFIAMENKYYEMMQFLLENGADINGFYSYDNHHFSYLEISTNGQRHDIEIIQFLVNAGADVNSPSWRRDHNVLAIDNLPGQFQSLPVLCEIAELLIEHGAYLENKDSAGQTPFLAAVNHKRDQLMNVLADGGANIHAKDRQGRNALQIALDSRDLQFYKQVEELMARGQQPSQYQPSKPQTQHRTSENGGNVSEDDELVTFENKSNQGTTTNKQARLQEIHDVLEIVQEAEINENKGVNGLLKLMKTMDTMPINERVAKVNEVLVFLDKSLTQAEPSKLLPKLKDCTLEEQEIFSDALQIKKTRRERLVDGVRIYALERELTQEDLQKAVNLMSSSMELHENESESWKRVIEVCNR